MQQISQTAKQQVASVFASNLVDNLRQIAPIHLDVVAMTGTPISGRMAVDYVPPTALVDNLLIAATIHVSYKMPSKGFATCYRFCMCDIPFSEVIENMSEPTYLMLLALRMCNEITSSANRLSNQGGIVAERLVGNEGMTLAVGQYGKRLMV